ncbi:FKBP-type peptidyl-prolyl cis-trans isomerase [Flavobacterium sp. DG2-3]|uniref:FKBP-type peptidyl-prolyl cis-trans isomerase n=1 Tax=Flavobacterium sp. DG2-3 TaxID=3068317 RepID=UPI00273D5ACB|nr:FKBP-type peptidylprolyl isomerase [Flavobacterium sp. DG2-3]MDP5202435.1 FKBP-type peptidylprolyl isomerase [Flavobacterium sp. DG2-3]
MNKFKYYFVLLLAGLAIVSCNKKDDDDPVVVPLRDYQEQFNTDNADIEEYLKTNYITVSANMDVTFTKITDPATQPSVMSYLNSPTYPKLLLREIPYVHGITYKAYYLVLREGSGTSPMNTDGVVTAYRGEYLKRVDATASEPTHLTTTLFEEVVYPKTSLDLFQTILGWSELFPQFKTGTTTYNEDGSANYQDFGAGVLFIPSGLGYYAGSSSGGTIPAYSPLIFTIKLYDYKRLDHENNGYSSAGELVLNPDGIFDYQEDLNGDGYVRDYRNTTLYPNPPANPDDSDGDLIPDFLDHDDDGDGYLTRFEITKPTGAPVTGLSLYYPYDPIGDNPATPNVDETETWGVPRRPTGELTDPTKPESITNPRLFVPEDYTAPGRLRIHLDKTYPYQKN